LAHPPILPSTTIEKIMSKLLDFMNHVDKNAEARFASAAVTLTLMASFGLSQVEQDAFLSGDPQNVASAIGMPASEITVIHIPATNTSYR
jgi:hypothetical protein